ncbi:hypothetical protein [Henriciella litoralis]|uniref:hypothetical protein n=1 Tax=Henriciella litoralis TaxID=568102 RepID=UPI000A0507E5|nr:hypothetical protein [Henriciella litoralis]
MRDVGLPHRLLATGLLAAMLAVSACTGKATAKPSTEQLTECYRSIQIANLRVRYSEELSASEIRTAQNELKDASTKVLQAWARREGVELKLTDDFTEESPRAQAFLDGVNIEAGINQQDLMDTIAEASADPSAWRSYYDAALDCTEEVAK